VIIFDLETIKCQCDLGLPVSDIKQFTPERWANVKGEWLGFECPSCGTTVQMRPAKTSQDAYEVIYSPGKEVMR
jgi:predicted RNA-binding Zn-ribbon protein involved in translation (DUF1610 family)